MIPDLKLKWDAFTEFKVINIDPGIYWCQSHNIIDKPLII